MCWIPSHLRSREKESSAPFLAFSSFPWTLPRNFQFDNKLWSRTRSSSSSHHKLGTTCCSPSHQTRSSVFCHNTVTCHSYKKGNCLISLRTRFKHITLYCTEWKREMFRNWHLLLVLLVHYISYLSELYQLNSAIWCRPHINKAFPICSDDVGEGALPIYFSYIFFISVYDKHQ